MILKIKSPHICRKCHNIKPVDTEMNVFLITEDGQIKHEYECVKCGNVDNGLSGYRTIFERREDEFSMGKWMDR